MKVPTGTTEYQIHQQDLKNEQLMQQMNRKIPECPISIGLKKNKKIKWIFSTFKSKPSLKHQTRHHATLFVNRKKTSKAKKRMDNKGSETKLPILTARACFLNPCFSRKCATLVLCSLGTVCKTLSAVSKSLLMTAVWYSRTETRSKKLTTFNSLSPK